MTQRFLIVAVALWCCAVPGWTQSQHVPAINLLENGDFQDSRPIGTVISYIKGWKMTGKFELSGKGPRHSVRIATDGSTLAQSVTTQPGQTYELSFRATSKSPVPIEGHAGLSMQKFMTSSHGTECRLEFTATEATTDISISAAKTDGTSGPVVSNISVVTLNPLEALSQNLYGLYADYTDTVRRGAFDKLASFYAPGFTFLDYKQRSLTTAEAIARIGPRPERLKMFVTFRRLGLKMEGQDGIATVERKISFDQLGSDEGNKRIHAHIVTCTLTDTWTKIGGFWKLKSSVESAHDHTVEGEHLPYL